MFRIRFLGTFSIGAETSAGRCPGIGTAGRECVAYLFQNTGRAFDRDLLIDRFWSRDAVADGRGALNTTVSRLRRALRSITHGADVSLDSDQWSVRIDLSPNVSIDSLDLLSLSDRLVSGRITPRQAMDLADHVYRGNFLPGCSGAWAVVERERLLSVFVRTMFDVSNTFAKSGRWQDAQDCCRAILLHDPLRERAHRRLMLLLAVQGEPLLAQRHYDDFRAFLAECCETEPTVETRDLSRRLCADLPLCEITRALNAEFRITATA